MGEADPGCKRAGTAVLLILLTGLVPVAGARWAGAAEAVPGEGGTSPPAVDPGNADQAAIRRTIQEVEGLVEATGQDFQLGLLVGGDGRHAYTVGERIEYFVRSERDAYVAVLCHQHSGASFPLLPNLLDDEVFFAAGQVAPINRGGNFDIAATSPGVDVIQAIGCVEREPIDRLIGSFGGRFDGEAETPFLPPTGRDAVIATWLEILREQPNMTCSSMAIRIRVTDRPAVATVTVWIEGLDPAREGSVTAALEAMDGVDAVENGNRLEGVWSLSVRSRVLAADLEEAIAAELPQHLVLRERLPGGIKFGPPEPARRWGFVWLICAGLAGLLRWLTS